MNLLRATSRSGSFFPFMLLTQCSRLRPHSKTPTPTCSRGFSPTRPTCAVSWSYSCGKMNGGRRSTRREDVGVGVVECGLKAIRKLHTRETRLINSQLLSVQHKQKVHKKLSSWTNVQTYPIDYTHKYVTWPWPWPFDPMINVHCPPAK